MVEYVGLDVSKEETAFCVKDEDGKVLASGKVSTDPESIFAVLKEHCLCPQRIVLETGALSAWLASGLRARGLPVEVVDARQAHAVMRLQHNKTDANDAELLAEIARSGFYHPVAVKSEAARHWWLLLKARAQAVDQRRDLENTIRGLLATFGIRFPKGVAKFAMRVEAILQQRAELGGAIAPLITVRAALERAIEKLEREVIAAAKANPACRLLMTTPGVASLTALAYLATIDDPERFTNSRNVGAYVGLTSRRWQSGKVDYGGRISKHGDKLLRSLLYSAANSMLTVVRHAHPLKDWARKVKRRTSHKKACVALARKLAVVLHRMLITGEPFRWPPKPEKVAA